MPRNLPTIHINRLPTNPMPLLRARKHNRARHINRRPRPPHRDIRLQPLPLLLTAGGVVPAGGVDDARADGVDVAIGVSRGHLNQRFNPAHIGLGPRHIKIIHPLKVQPVLRRGSEGGGIDFEAVSSDDALVVDAPSGCNVLIDKGGSRCLCS